MTIGRIYKIVSGQTNECYVGSTFNELKYRFRQHKDDYKKWKDGKATRCASFDLFDKFGLQNCKIILIREYDVVDKQHLKVYEQLWINKLKPINKVNPFWIKILTHKLQYKKLIENNPNHNQDDYQKRLARNPNHNQDEYQRKLRNNPNFNKDVYEKRRQQQLKNKAEKITCECGKIISRGNISKHIITKSHLEKTKT